VSALQRHAAQFGVGGWQHVASRGAGERLALELGDAQRRAALGLEGVGADSDRQVPPRASATITPSGPSASARAPWRITGVIARVTS
jgi:hypothetical protein